MTAISWENILWGSVNMNKLDWGRIKWAGIDYQTFFNIMLHYRRDTNGREITTLLSKNYKSLRDFVKDLEAWSIENENHEHTKALSIVKRFLSQRNKSVNQRTKNWFKY